MLRERVTTHSALVWLALLPGLAALIFLTGEFLGKW
jgi:hypothetical protein